MGTVTERVGLVGVGLVGTALAEVLIARGYAVVGHDLAEEACRRLATLGGEAVASPAAVAAACTRVILSLPDSAIVRQVVAGRDGLLAAGHRPLTVIDTTTGDPDETAALAARLAGLGIPYLDATVSGSSDQVRRRGGTFMVGGDRVVFEDNRDLLAALGDRVYHLGPAGSGARAKLATNLVLGLNRLALAEGLVFAERLGLDLTAVLAVLRDSPAYSAAMDVKGRRMLEEDFRPESRVRQHLKDVELILRHADRAGQELPLTAVHRDLLSRAVAAGDGDLDNAAVIRELRRRRPGLGT